MTTISAAMESLQAFHVAAGDLLTEISTAVPGVQPSHLTINATAGLKEIHLNVDAWHFEATVEHLGIGPVHRNGDTWFAGGTWNDRRVLLHCWSDVEQASKAAA